MFCSPRFTEILVRNIEKLGGVCYMFLTHKFDNRSLTILIVFYSLGRGMFTSQFS